MKKVFFIFVLAITLASCASVRKTADHNGRYSNIGATPPKPIASNATFK